MFRLEGHRARQVRRQIRAALIVPLVALLGLLGPAASAAPPAAPELTVMTRNIYLGSSLQPALEAETPDEFIGAVAAIYGTVRFTDFPARASGLAAEIAATEPDLIGLQEVSRWQVTPVANPFVDPEALSFDFLQILVDALAARGLRYSVAGSVDNALIGPAPLIAPGTGCDDLVQLPDKIVPECVVTFADRDVVLVNDNTEGLNLEPATTGRYESQVTLSTAVGDLSFDRGWVSVDGRYRGKSFRFVNTHLETEDSPAVQEAQAVEFLSGPARGGPVIAVGDFNSAPDGSTTDSYARLTGPSAFTDAWTVNPLDLGLTCCQSSTLVNVTSQAQSRIDLVLTRGPIRPLSAALVGAQRFRSTPPLWASDHAGVVATVRLR